MARINLGRVRGQDGYTPRKGIDYFDGEPGKDGYTPQKGIDYFDGAPGDDGFSPTVEVTDITGGHKVTITDKDGNHEFVVKDGKDGQGGGLPYTLVDYMETEKEAVENRIQTIVSTIDNPIVIGFSTDQHCKAVASGDWVQKKEDITQAIKALANLTYDIDYDLCVGGGDNVASNYNANEVRQIVELMNKCNCPTFNLMGNHDATDGTDYQLYHPHVTDSVESGRIKMYESATWNNSGYMDSAKHKVRFIFVDNWKRNGGAVYSERMTMLRKFLSEMPLGYKAIIFSHVGIDSALPTDSSDRTVGWNNILDMSEVLNDYAEGVICVINGHNHNSLSAFVNGIRHISTTCAGLYELNDGLPRVNGTAKSTAFDTFIIDVENNRIHIVRFGVGSDRSCLIKESAHHVNAIPTSIDTDGSVYNGIGYKVGYRLNSNGTETAIAQEQLATEMAISGFIPCQADDVLSFDDGIIVPDESAYNASQPSTVSWSSFGSSNYMSIYDASFAKIYSKSVASFLTASELSKYITDLTYWASGCVKSFKITSTTTSYFRLSANGIKDGKLVTVNDEL